MTNVVRKLSELGSKCEYNSCQLPATEITYDGVSKQVLLCCDLHAWTVAGNSHPEFISSCNNCGCLNPVN